MTLKDARTETFCGLVLHTLALLVAWWAAYAIRFQSTLPVPKGVPAPLHYVKLTPVMLVAMLSAQKMFCRHPFALRAGAGHFFSALRADILGWVFFVGACAFYHELRISRLSLVLFGGLTPFATALARPAGRRILRRLTRSGSTQSRSLLITSRKQASEAVHFFRTAYQDTQLELALTDGGTPTHLGERLEAWAKGLQIAPLEAYVHPGTSQLLPVCYETVCLYLPASQASLQERLLLANSDQFINIDLVADLSLSPLGFQPRVVAGRAVFALHHSPLESYWSAIKRLSDVLGASLALLLFGPLMLVLALGVRLSSPGPIFFRQRRIGLGGHPFEMLKFRSMPLSAEADTGAVWSTPGDRRPTPLGRWMRRLSLDELPQLLNVLAGEMSLVGPRPERPIFVEQFRHSIPGYMLRHKVRAGMTGWAQVHGWRGNTSLENRIACDLYYIRNWSLALDAKILFLTVFRGFYHPNAH